MNVFCNKNQIPGIKIHEEDLKFYGEQLLKLVYLYRTHIVVKTEEQERALMELEYYATSILSKDYNRVIMNAHEIIEREDNVVHSPPHDDKYPF